MKEMDECSKVMPGRRVPGRMLLSVCGGWGVLDTVGRAEDSRGGRPSEGEREALWKRHKVTDHEKKSVFFLKYSPKKLFLVNFVYRGMDERT